MRAGFRGIDAAGNRPLLRGVFLALLFLLSLALPLPASAQAACEFATAGSTMFLLNDCVTIEPIEVPDGITLDGGFHAITAADPAGGSFRGPVIRARGGSASVVNTAIAAQGLRDVCHEGADRLRGIYFEGASGVIRGNAVNGIHKTGSACEEGTAIEVRNPWNNGSTAMVTIEANIVDGYQKAGLVLHGGVDATVRGNAIGASASQHLLAANSIQVGPGGRATVEDNVIIGNSHADPDAAATAILLVGSAPGTTVRSNTILGNADVGIHVMADGAVVAGNDLIDEGPDGAWDIGLVNLGDGNLFSGNRVDGYRTRDRGLDGAGDAAGAAQLE